MTTKELLQNEIEQLDEQYIDEIYEYVKNFVQHKKSEPKPKRKKKKYLLDELSKISMNGPKDLSTNHDLYVTGEKTF